MKRAVALWGVLISLQAYGAPLCSDLFSEGPPAAVTIPSDKLEAMLDNLAALYNELQLTQDPKIKKPLVEDFKEKFRMIEDLAGFPIQEIILRKAAGQSVRLADRLVEKSVRKEEQRKALTQGYFKRFEIPALEPRHFEFLEDSLIAIWDKESLKIYDHVKGEIVDSMEFVQPVSAAQFRTLVSPDFQTLYAISKGGIQIFDRRQKQVSFTATAWTNRMDWRLSSLRISPDGKYLAITARGDRDALLYSQELHLMEIPSMRPLATLKQKHIFGEKSGFEDVLFSPDGRYLVAYDHGNTPSIFDIQKGTAVLKAKAWWNPILLHKKTRTRWYRAGFADSNTLLVNDDSGRMWSYDLSRRTYTSIPADAPTYVKTMLPSPDGREIWFLYANHKDYKIFNPSTGLIREAQIPSLVGLDKRTKGGYQAPFFFFDDRAELIYSPYLDLKLEREGLPHLYRVNTDPLQPENQPQGRWMLHQRASADGQRLLFSSGGNKFYLLDLR